MMSTQTRSVVHHQYGAFGDSLPLIWPTFPRGPIQWRNFCAIRTIHFAGRAAARRNAASLMYATQPTIWWDVKFSAADLGALRRFATIIATHASFGTDDEGDAGVMITPELWNQVITPENRSSAVRYQAETGSDLISIVIPAYQSSVSLPILIVQLEGVLDALGQEFEIIVVDDGSPDRTWETLRTLKQAHPRLRIARLVRNSGQHNATLCGFGLARGSIVVTMDDDLQNPAEELPKLIAAIHDGYDLAIGAYGRSGRRLGRNLGGELIDALQRRMFGLPPEFQLTSFRAVRKAVVDNALSMGGVFPYITAMLLSHTSRVVNVPVRHEPRPFGRSNYNLTRSGLLACNLLLSYSRYPLYLLAALCCISVAFSIGVGTWVLWLRLVGTTLPGWASTVIVMSVFNGAILLALVVHGLYLFQITQQISRSRVGYTIGELHE
jgi:glycosyltransferase involved in cell wall biosynthesis